MSQNEADTQPLDVAEPLTVTYAYFNLDRRLVWFQVNRTPEEVFKCVLALHFLNGVDKSYISLRRLDDESIIGLRVTEGYTEYPELFGRLAHMLAVFLDAPFSTTFLFRDKGDHTKPMRLPKFAEAFRLDGLLESLRIDPETTLADELEAVLAEAVSMTRAGDS